MSKSKTKHYEFLFTAMAGVVVVAAESEEEAEEFARDAVSFGDFDETECRLERVIPEEELERAKQTADCIALPD